MPDAPDPRRASQGMYPALSLYQLIGAPLHALVDAEKQSALATADFIEQFGFERRRGDEAAGRGGWELGDLRMARFSTRRSGPDGATRDVEVEVPLLSMLPLPALQIKDAELEFFVKIVDVASYRAEATAAEPEGGRAAGAGPAAEERPASALDALSQRVQFKGALGRPRSGSVQGRQSMEMQVHIKVRVEQADVPAGMARLFNLLEHSIQARETAAPEGADAAGGGPVAPADRE